MKTSELTGAALDWAVAKCEGTLHDDGTVSDYFQPSVDWEQAGAIIECGGISIVRVSDSIWDAHMSNVNFYESGTTPLIAAMRCYVASKMGDDVTVPEELQGETA
jgi:hypothetical protein